MTTRRRSQTWLAPTAKADARWGTNPARLDIEHVLRATAWLGRFFGPTGYFPVRATGLSALTESPSLFVSNHSGGSTVLDCLGLAYAWYQHFAHRRPLHFLAHEILMATRLTGPFLDRLGVLGASSATAHQTLGDWGRDLVVMPGGDGDAWRPWRDRYRVCFGGRTGYARVALETGVPAVPVANAGPHSTLMVLTDGRGLAKRLRLHELLRIDVFPIHLSLPWGLGIGPFPHLPLPTPLRYRFGRAVTFPQGHEMGAPVHESQVLEYDRRVRAALQELLDLHAAEDNPERARTRVSRHAA